MTTLELGSNQITDRGIEYIANALQYNSVRLILSLSVHLLSLNTDSC